MPPMRFTCGPQRGLGTLGRPWYAACTVAAATQIRLRGPGGIERRSQPGGLRMELRAQDFMDCPNPITPQDVLLEQAADLLCHVRSLVSLGRMVLGEDPNGAVSWREPDPRTVASTRAGLLMVCPRVDVLSDQLAQTIQMCDSAAS